MLIYILCAHPRTHGVVSPHATSARRSFQSERRTLTDGSTRRQSPAPLAGGPAATLTRQQQHTLPSARSISPVRTCVYVRPTPQSHMQREGANHNQIICEAGINAHAKR